MWSIACLMCPVETLKSIDILENGYKDWNNQNINYRSKLLHKWANIIEENIESLSALLTEEQGKPIAQSKGEFIWAITSIRNYATIAKNTHGYTPIQTDPNTQTIVVKESLGIVGIITPWNFPVVLSLTNISAAISVGNTVICKTSEETPLTLAATIAMAYEAGIPENVIQYVTAQNPVEIGRTICSDDRVKMLCFTGSTATGKKLYKDCANGVKKLLLELGGNAPFVVFDDADIELAAADAAKFKFANSGQICININRFIIHNDVYDKFIECFTKHAKSQVVGNGLDSSTTMGPLINQKGLDKVTSLVKDSVEKGAEIVYGGDLLKENSLLYSPTVIQNVTPDMEIFKNEIFGPVAACYRFDSDEEMIQMANNTEFGLAAYCYTSNLSRAIKFGKQIQSGGVGINSTDFGGGPFGGFKQSGVGRTKGHVNPLEAYCETKTINMKII